MPTANPPLFVQDGEYPAHLDRSLIGALLISSGLGDDPLVPRGGVRAHLLNSQGIETSLYVERNTNISFKVHSGSAFVPGVLDDGLGATYLIINPNEQFVPVPSPIGSDQTGVIGIQITDPATVPAAGEGSWAFVYIPSTSSLPSTGFLSLARITIPADTTKVPTAEDIRPYTTSLGGVFRAASFATLVQNGNYLPYGSQAFCWAEDLLYIRTKEGWRQHPAVTVANTAITNDGITGHQGELLWNSATNTLSVYQKPKWVDIAKAYSSVRLATGTSWPDPPNEATQTGDNMKLHIKTAGTWYPIQSSQIGLWDNEPNDLKPSWQSLSLQVDVKAPKTLVMVTVNARIENYKKDGTSFVLDNSNRFSLTMDAHTATKFEFDPETGEPEGYVEQYTLADETAMMWTTVFDQKNWHADWLRLDQGLVTITPRFKMDKVGYVHIISLNMTVSTK